MICDPDRPEMEYPIADEGMNLDSVTQHPRQNLDSQRFVLLQEIERLSKLPKSSSYAQHRLRIAENAIAILNKADKDIDAEDMDELENALKQLGL
jgi:hypothetical protein